MGIEGLGPIRNVGGVDGPSRAKRASESGDVKKDKVSVSSEARDKLSFEKALNEVKNAPDVREKRIEEVKKSLEKATESEVLDQTSSNLLKALGLGE